MALGTKEKNGKSTADKHDIKGSVVETLKNKDEANKLISPERNKALGLALDSIKKAYGDGSIMRLGDSRQSGIETVPTGALSLDVALGVGGVPRGRIIEIYGPESSGKTTLAQHIAAEVQKMGGIAAIVDAEHAMDPEYARALGVNVDELLISQPDTGEQALEITEQLVRSGAVDLVIIDSVAEKDSVEYGNRVKVKVVKNKVAPPFRIAEFDIIYGRGISTSGCVLDMATELEIVKKSGTWFSYKDERIGQGRDTARNFLEANPPMLAEIDARVRAALAAKIATSKEKTKPDAKDDKDDDAAE
ncbi:MAG: hypothetical protein HYX67_04875 [Candidatus Melainabacteria bacterium]|nr:hypothetical protein [Candidatus Melainabacteria bacterium]